MTHESLVHFLSIVKQSHLMNKKFDADIDKLETIV